MSTSSFISGCKTSTPGKVGDIQNAVAMVGERQFLHGAYSKSLKAKAPEGQVVEQQRQPGRKETRLKEKQVSDSRAAAGPQKPDAENTADQLFSRYASLTLQPVNLPASLRQTRTSSSGREEHQKPTALVCKPQKVEQRHPATAPTCELQVFIPRHLGAQLVSRCAEVPPRPLL